MKRIKFLGTSNANPHVDRRQSGLILEIENNFYLVECGDGIPSAIWNDTSINMNNIHAVFCSHLHGDHVGGLLAFVLLMHQRIKNSKKNQPGTNIERKIPLNKLNKPYKGNLIFLPTKKSAKLFKTAASMAHTSNLKIAYHQEYLSYNTNQTIYQDNLIKVSSFPTKHTKESHGFIISIEDYNILFSGDIQSPKVLIPNLENIDFAIVECAHFPPEEIVKVFKDQMVKKIIVNHINDKYLDDIKKLEKSFSPLTKHMEVIIAYDGLEINF